MLKYNCDFTTTDTAEVTKQEVIDYIKILYCEDPHVVEVHINKLNLHKEK